jgi:hypothetical protein
MAGGSVIRREQQAVICATFLHDPRFVAQNPCF